MDTTKRRTATKRAVSVRVTGSVQGVGFRYHAVRAARDCGVTGFVSNLDDGSVLAVAEGEFAAVERFVQAMRAGPRPSLVRGVEICELEPSRGYEGFDVRYAASPWETD
jgi:acylphosphatase